MLFRVEVSTSSRKSSNQSAMAAYRAGERLIDEHGQSFSYARRTAVMESWLTMPEDAPDWDRERLWQEVGLAEKRKDSVLCREVLIELAPELSPAERKRLVQEHAQWLAARYNTAVDVALHKPTRRQDPRHFHAHLLLPTRVLTADGLGRKLIELDVHKGGRQHVHAIREHVAQVTNAAFERSGLEHRVDPRSKRRRKLALGAKLQALKSLITNRKGKTMADDHTVANKPTWQEMLKELAERQSAKEQEREKQKTPQQKALETLKKYAPRRDKGLER